MVNVVCMLYTVVKASVGKHALIVVIMHGINVSQY